ncbi:MAG: hypothetical protein KatS3mg011_1383 [Acidimicrobiia bacterium]|nr:MAG: hypothetical protein KatS3mg011_1383 [Acidimicrobiia bacterium]
MNDGTVTFLRTRPAQVVNDAAASARRAEGTTVLEVRRIEPAWMEAATKSGIQLVRRGVGGDDEPDPAAWVVDPRGALLLAGRGVPGWRITLGAANRPETVLDALSRTGAAFLRAPISRLDTAAHLASLPGIRTRVSVYVDDVDQATRAVEAGASDLLLRDWDADRIAELRDALGAVPLVERTVFPIGLEIDEARRVLPKGVFTVWLLQSDGSGAARPRYGWAPGKPEHPPVPAARLSAEWADSVWVGSRAPERLEGAGRLGPLLERVLEGHRPDVDDLEAMFRARGSQVEAVAWVADQLRRAAVGNVVTYVVNRNINYTNLCYFRCGFCAFSKGPRSLNLRGDPYLMSIGEIVDKAVEAWDRGATEVTLQGGIHPEFTGEFYLRVVEAIKQALPSMHIHGFTPLEVWQGAETLGVGVAEFLRRLADVGLGSLPGTAAEILDDEVRAFLCPDKIRTAQWVEVMLLAHEVGLRATSTIMFGHIDHPRAWARHLDVLRWIQARTGVFTELVPLPFVHMGAPIFLRGSSRPGPTWDEVVLIHAVGRIALHGLVPNIQASWVKLGLDGAARLLDAGCNDLGGTLMGEIITRSAGASHGQEVTPARFEETIRAAGREPARRDTLYRLVEAGSAGGVSTG